LDAPGLGDWAAMDGVQGGGPSHMAVGASSVAAEATSLPSQGMGIGWTRGVGGEEFTDFMPRRESHSRGPRVERQFTQLSPQSSDFAGSESEEENANTWDPIMNGMRHEFQDNTWSQEFFTYDPKLKEFFGSHGPCSFFAGIPTLLQLFDLFWPYALLLKIVQETNRYATRLLDALGNCMGGPKWVNLTIAGLKAFLAIHMYMGMKRQPNNKSY
jgi:hypothetical protein